MEKELREGGAKLARHAAVDGEVDRVGENDEEVGDQYDGVQRVVVHQAHRGDVLHDVEDGGDGEGNFEQEEHRDDHYEHDGGGVGVTFGGADGDGGCRRR